MKEKPPQMALLSVKTMSQTWLVSQNICTIINTVPVFDPDTGKSGDLRYEVKQGNATHTLKKKKETGTK